MLNEKDLELASTVVDYDMVVVTKGARKVHAIILHHQGEQRLPVDSRPESDPITRQYQVRVVPFLEEKEIGSIKTIHSIDYGIRGHENALYITVANSDSLKINTETVWALGPQSVISATMAMRGMGLMSYAFNLLIDRVKTAYESGDTDHSFSPYSEWSMSRSVNLTAANAQDDISQITRNSFYIRNGFTLSGLEGESDLDVVNGGANAQFSDLRSNPESFSSIKRSPYYSYASSILGLDSNHKLLSGELDAHDLSKSFSREVVRCIENRIVISKKLEKCLLRRDEAAIKLPQTLGGKAKEFFKGQPLKRRYQALNQEVDRVQGLKDNSNEALTKAISKIQGNG